MLGAVVVTVGHQYFNISVSSYIYSLASYDKTRFPGYLRTPQFDAFVVGCFITGAYFCCSHLQRQVRSVPKTSATRSARCFAHRR